MKNKKTLAFILFIVMHTGIASASITTSPHGGSGNHDQTNQAPTDDQDREMRKEKRKKTSAPNSGQTTQKPPKPSTTQTEAIKRDKGGKRCTSTFGCKTYRYN